MTRRAYLYFTLTFLFGVVVGGAGTYYYAWHAGLWHRRFSKEGMVTHLTNELHLSDQQVQQLHQIIDDADKRHQQLQSQVNADQAAKFDELERQAAERRRRRGPPAP